MAKILVIGSLDLAHPAHSQFLASLGSEIADQRHHLLNGCRNHLDKAVAHGAFARLTETGQNPGTHITSYVTGESAPVHSYGTILKSRCPNWESLASPGLDVPETIQQTDVVVVIGGTDGTECAANWARIAQKPIVPVAAFGGAAARIYDEELRQFADKYADRLDRGEFELLNQVPRSEEHTSELQSQSNIVCRLLLEKKNYNYKKKTASSGFMVPHYRGIAAH